MSNGEINVFERLFKLWAMVTKLIMDGKRDPHKVADILQRIVDKVDASSSFTYGYTLIAVSKMVVNNSRSIDASVKAGCYDYVDCDVSDKNFPSNQTGEQEVKTAMFYFGQNMSSSGVIAAMNEAGFRPSTMKELLAYGEKNPDEQRKYPIVELGSVASKSVGCLCSNTGRRDLCLGCFDGVWYDHFRFLAVLKALAI